MLPEKTITVQYILETDEEISELQIQMIKKNSLVESHYIVSLLCSWPWLYGSWIYNYLWNQCLSPLMLWVRISIRVRCTTLCVKVCQWLATVWWFSPGPPFSSTNKTDHHDITEILLKVTLNTIKQTNKKQTHLISLCFLQSGYKMNEWFLWAILQLYHSDI